MKRYAVGIDLGGTFIKYAIISSEGEMLFDGKVPSCADRDGDAVCGQIVKAVEICKQEATTLGITLEGVGIGTPGVVDEAGKTVVDCANITGWSGYPIAAAVEKATGLRTLVDNDANLMALGEARYGAARGCTDVVFLTVGTGIGGGVMIGGKLYGGYRNRGTELGHVPLVADGEPCGCGSVGCLERYASTAALVRRFNKRCEEAGVEWPGREADGHFIVELFLAGNPIATECIEEHCRYLGHGVSGIINTFSPQKVVIGGGISESGPFYIEKITQYAMRYAVKGCAVNTGLAAAELGNRAGSFGAAALIL